MKPSHAAVLLNVLLLAFLISELTCEQAEQIDFSSGKDELNNEKKLINDLFSNYRVKFGRPVANRSEKVVVSFEVFLVQIIDLDERDQVLITNVETQYVWKDNGLKWDKDKYGGVEDIRLPVNEIWTPDIVLYNYADTRLEEKREVLAIISHDGKVKWRPACIFKSTCQINIQKFPYDHQNCLMKFGSWTYDGDSIDIQFLDKPEINRELFLSSNEWDVISTQGHRNEKKYECCNEIFPDITYEIKMKRKGGFYNYILVLPCILLSCLTTVLFWLPPESPAKMLLGMNIFTSFFVLLLLLSKNVPSATDKIPLIGAYYCLNMAMIATSTCSCALVVHVYFRGQGKVPYLVRKIFLEFLARILCMTSPTIVVQHEPKPKCGDTSDNLREEQLKKMTNDKSSISLNLDGDRTQSSYRMVPQHSPKLMNPIQELKLYNQAGTTKIISFRNHKSMQSSNGDFYRQTSVPVYDKKPCRSRQESQLHERGDQLNRELSTNFNLIENDIREIRDYLRHTRKKTDSNDLKNKNTNEWKQVALILDRTLFFIYIIAIVVSVTLMFPR